MLRDTAYRHFTSKEIKPSGWLKDQLRIQAEGLSGNLDKVWPDVRDSRWIGGDRDGWERVPYWLDGFIPLAYLLEDDDMITRAKKYIDSIIANQEEDGWLCPCERDQRGTYDAWPLFLMSKVLVLYYECSGDERVEEVLYRAFKQFSEHSRGTTIRNWAHSRWFESLISLFWLYERRKEEWIIALAVTMYSQGLDYKNLFDNWHDFLPRNEWSFQTHVVNLAMALKSEALVSRFSGKDSDEFAEKMISMLFEYHGTAAGHFTGDECLGGLSPIRGTELCGVVEAMYSYETLFEITGKTKWIDRLERLAFNALPATTSADMWTHQYDQMTNQIECSRMEKPIFGSNCGESHLFGLEPNYGCCTANFNQGWPKFALSTFFRSDNGIVSASLAPSVLSTEINGAMVTCELKTLYPFRDTLTYIITCDRDVSFDLSIRIPSFSQGAVVGKSVFSAGEMCTLSREWKKGENTVEVRMKNEFSFVNRPNNMVALNRGALTFVVAIKEKWVMHEYESYGVERKFPYCDYSIYPESKWNYAFDNTNFRYHENDSFDRPFSNEHPPVFALADMAEIDWGFEEGYTNVCSANPESRKKICTAKNVRLIPYGCSELRMCEMPFIK